MNPIVTGVLAGVAGTVVMDSMNRLLARMGLLLGIDMGALGRMAAGWTRGRFRYRRPEDLEPVGHERLLGHLTHYLIGIGLALPFVVGWDLLIGGLPSVLWTLAYGLATTVASLFLVYPSLGLGLGGHRSAEGLRAPLSSLFNHLFFGVGMALVVLAA